MKDKMFGIVYSIDRSIKDQKVFEEDEIIAISKEPSWFYSDDVLYSGMVSALDDLRLKGRVCGRHSDQRFDKHRKKMLDHKHRRRGTEWSNKSFVGNSKALFAYKHHPARPDVDWDGEEAVPYFALPEQTPNGLHMAKAEKLHAAAEAKRNLNKAIKAYEEAMKKI